MKRLIVFISIIISSFSVFAQDKDIATVTHKVEGSCNMCKKRIEEAAFVKGVKRADWDKETHVLTVVYRPSKTTDEAILQSITQAGHSTDKLVATDANYEKLPKCCHYKTESCTH